MNLIYLKISFMGYNMTILPLEKRFSLISDLTLIKQNLQFYSKLHILLSNATLKK